MSPLILFCLLVGAMLFEKKPRAPSFLIGSG